MKSKNILNKMSVDQAYKNLEDAVESFLKMAQWHSPYNGFIHNKHRIKTPINELRKPLLELKLAKKNLKRLV